MNNIKKLSNKQIELKLKDIEDIIKSRDDFTRYNIQSALDSIKGMGLNINDKKMILKKMIERSGVKKIGLKTSYEPRQELKEGDKTFKFLDDILSYRGVIEEY